MLFNSFEFIAVFFPLALIGYFLSSRIPLDYSKKIWLIFCGLLFYGLFNPKYVVLIIASIIVNYCISIFMHNKSAEKAYGKKAVLASGIIFNIALLIYFKYTNFFIENINILISSKIELLKILFPVGISFYTFQQIAFLVDTYKGKTGQLNPVDYVLFITFFPHLTAGPIVRHNETIPQFKTADTGRLNYQNIACGIFLFSIGLFKKIIIADKAAVWAVRGLDGIQNPDLLEAWISITAYSIQLYFDFSGYTDMALGIARCFNIKLPINFDSPYQSTSPIEFWKRWHITLSRFLRDYIYIPLGGNRHGELRQNTNTLITFIIAGMWHGSGWTFIAWGLIWAIGLIINRSWNKMQFNIPKLISLVFFITFWYTTLIFFRSKSIAKAVDFTKGFYGFNGINLPSLKPWFATANFFHIKPGIWLAGLGGWDWSILVLFIAAGIIIWFPKNSNKLADNFKPNIPNLLLSSLLLGISLIHLTQISEFLYFNY
jgi:D-alanyl-lipoteichoic acid acyltransferase DltB (MBOAT superfamily)